MSLREVFADYRREIAAVGASLAVLAGATFLATRPSKIETIVQQPIKAQVKPPVEEVKGFYPPETEAPKRPQYITSKDIPCYASTEDSFRMSEAITRSKIVDALMAPDWKAMAEQYGLDRKPDFNRQTETIPSTPWNYNGKGKRQEK